MSIIYEEQKRELAFAGIARDILREAQTELYMNMRFLDVALSSLSLMPDSGIRITGTDGTYLYFQPEPVAGLFRRGREAVNRQYLHSILHCLFAHLWTRQERDEEYWNLACDIAVEQVIDGLYIRAVHRPVPTGRRELYRAVEADAASGRLRETAPASPAGVPGGTAGNRPVITAQCVYRYLCRTHPIQAQLDRIKTEFTVDDHSRWGQEHKSGLQSPQQRWEDLRDRMQTEMETFGKDAAEGAQSLEEQVCAVNRKRYDYRDFLRKFSVLKEEMQVDMDSFDYIFYNYGMELYGNMPLIEPLETKEMKKVEDFVLVLDTSMSCKGELLQHFLEETFSILSESESFSRKIRLHILQCDDQVQEDVLITNQEEMRDYLANFTIRGFGGTDFRPAFAYVQELLGRQCFRKLRGLIYFTDGYGVFPVKKPPYETAFVFLREDYRDVDVPPWAIKLIVDREALEGIPRR